MRPSSIQAIPRAALMSTRNRIAVVRCVALDKLRQEDDVYQTASSVSVKLHANSLFSALVETVTVQTQRHAALWQDAALWTNIGNLWKPQEIDTTRYHLLEVFTMGQQFCQSGVAPRPELCKTSMSKDPLADTLLFTIISDGSPCTLLTLAKMPCSRSSGSDWHDVVSGAHHPAFSPLQTTQMPSSLAMEAAALPATSPCRAVDVPESPPALPQSSHSCFRDFVGLHPPEQGVDAIPHRPAAPSLSAPVTHVRTPSFDSQKIFDDDLHAEWLGDEAPCQAHLPEQLATKMSGVNADASLTQVGATDLLPVSPVNASRVARPSPVQPEMNQLQPDQCTSQSSHQHRLRATDAGNFVPVSSAVPANNPRAMFPPDHRRGYPDLYRPGEPCNSDNSATQSEVQLDYMQRLHLATKLVRRDMSAYNLPSTLLQLLSLGPSVITVAEVFGVAMPFSPAQISTSRFFINRIQNHKLPKGTADAAINDLQKSCEYSATVKHLYINEAAAELLRLAQDKDMSRGDAEEAVLKKYGERTVDPRKNFSVRVTNPRLQCDFLAMAAAKEWRPKVQFLSDIVLPHLGREVHRKEFKEMVAKATDVMSKYVFHKGLIDMTREWLKRLHRLMREQAKQADPCDIASLSLRKIDGCQPLFLELATTLEALLPRTPEFIKILGQYTAAHEAHIVKASRQGSTPDEPTSLFKDGLFRLTPALYSATHQAIQRCLADVRNHSGPLTRSPSATSEEAHPADPAPPPRTPQSHRAAPRHAAPRHAAPRPAASRPAALRRVGQSAPAGPARASRPDRQPAPRAAEEKRVMVVGYKRQPRRVDTHTLPPLSRSRPGELQADASRPVRPQGNSARGRQPAGQRISPDRRTTTGQQRR
eukprot:jgi/Ulvmu1/9/UM001_0009.1